jgi:alginate O-acetyltransferase complex protein AlgI
MTFTDTRFVILLLATYPLWLLCGRRYWPRLMVLLAASLVFYGHDDWRLLLLLGAYAVMDWTIAGWIARSDRPRLPLRIGIVFNLGVLIVWKYTPMVVGTLAWVTDRDLPGPRADGWVVPFGLSFYSFTGIAYMVDVYRGVTRADRNLARSALHLSFFPHLMAGPILRAGELLERLGPERLPRRTEAPREAALLLARGCFKKMVLADRIALAIDPYFLHAGQPATLGVWALPYLYLYAFQIYFDFSGYTDIARGLALLFGFRWPENFNLPYLARSPRDFWRRWHITLSRFLRDYVYIPLGGNRRGRWRTHLNVMVTMLLGGLWHGGSWSFMVWGGLHGAFLVIDRMWAESRLLDRLRPFRHDAASRAAGRTLSIFLTFNLTCLTWAFFRLTVVSHSLACLRATVIFDADKRFVGGSADPWLWLLLAMYGGLVLVARQSRQLAPSAAGDRRALSLANGFVWGAAVAGFALAVLLAPGGEPPPFIYFQF